VSPQATRLAALPISRTADNLYDARIVATLDDRGGLVARVEETTRGGAAAHLRGVRAELRADMFQQVIETRLRETMPAVQELHWTEQWEPAAAEWRLNFDFKSDRYARRTGGALLMVSPVIVFGKVRLAPWKTDRDGVAWVMGSTVRKQVRLALPDDVVIEEMPDDVELTSANIACRLTYRREGPAVVYGYALTEAGGFLNQSDYEMRRAFIQKLQDAERRPLVLRRQSTEKPAPKS